MATAAKVVKEKTCTTTPRLLPRQTAASLARAARNATNRNLPVQPSQRQSPNRGLALPSANNIGKNSVPRPFQKTDSKTEFKELPMSDIELLTLENDCHNIDGCSNENNAIENTDRLDNTAAYIPDSNETDTFEEISTSRPVTPAMISRPQTPSIQSSRPQTPRIRSRPTTPANPPHHSTPASRPSTPQYSVPSRPRTPSSIPTTVCNRVMTYTSPQVIRPGSPCKEDGELKSTYISKQKLFHNLKKELDMKQRAVLEVFDCLKLLREQLSRNGKFGSCGDEFLQKELVLFNVADWTAEEVSQLYQDAFAPMTTEGALKTISTTAPIEESTFVEMEGRVNNVPANFADLCLQAFTVRQELIDWIKELIEKYEIIDSSLIERITRYNTEGLELCDALRNLKARSDEAIGAMTQISKRAIQERSTLLSVGESLVREIERMRQDLEAQANIINEMRENRVDTDVVKVLEETKRELEEERAARLASNSKLSATESQLKQTRVRLAKMDRQLREAEASIASLTGTVKGLEDQSRQREVQLEARARKLKESLKTGEVATSHLSQQRDALQNEVTDLKEHIETITTENKLIIKNLNDELNELKNSLEEKCKLVETEIELRQAAESSVIENQNTVEELKAKISELESAKPNPDLPTEREMDLWAELQATKDTLSLAEEEVLACKREKTRFLESFTKIAESDHNVGMQQKLAAELLSKEEILAKMQMQIRDMTKNMKLNEQKVIQYEQYIRNLQEHNRAVANCQEVSNDISYQDLQQEILNLRMSLLEAVNRNEELSDALMQKEQQLEHQDKTSRAQARVIKVREELINMLKNKETEQSRELAALQNDLEHRMKIVDEVNKQIASKAFEIQELFATLENKQQQIHRLEKIVLALEEQQKRAQAQRTRHEEKIAALEHELAAGNRRERMPLSKLDQIKIRPNGKHQLSNKKESSKSFNLDESYEKVPVLLKMYHPVRKSIGFND